MKAHDVLCTLRLIEGTDRRAAVRLVGRDRLVLVCTVLRVERGMVSLLVEDQCRPETRTIRVNDVAAVAVEPILSPAAARALHSGEDHALNDADSFARLYAKAGR